MAIFLIVSPRDFDMNENLFEIIQNGIILD